MKDIKKAILIIVMGITMLSVTISNASFEAGREWQDEHNNLDEVYASYLNTILPGDEYGFTYIVFNNESNCYFIGHNVTKEQWEILESSYDVVFPNYTFQFFNGRGLYHKPFGGIIFD